MTYKAVATMSTYANLNRPQAKVLSNAHYSPFDYFSVVAKKAYIYLSLISRAFYLAMTTKSLTIAKFVKKIILVSGCR